MSPIAKRRKTDMPSATEASNGGDSTAITIAMAAQNAANEAAKKHQKQQQKNSLTAQAAGEMSSYKSNVFRMETDEMLQEISFNYGSKKMAAVEKILHQLKSAIDAIPDKAGVKIAQAESEMQKKKIQIPFPDPKPAKDIQYNFAYAKPSYVNVAGSYALKTQVKAKEGLSIDFVLTMPEGLFQEKDYLNYRYFYKRAYYLAVIAGGLHDAKDLKGIEVKYDYLNGDQLKPILVITPTETDAKSPKCTINIIPSVAPSVFPAKKLYPLKNCVRPQQTDAEAPKEYDPTPAYNASLAADTTYFPYLSALHKSSSTCAAFNDACMLGRVWLRQRGFGGALSKGGFGHFEWAILQSFLLKGGGAKGHALLANGYSNYQMFKAMIQFLAQRNLAITPLVFGTSENVKTAAKHPVIFDGEHGVNVLFKMTPWSYDLLKHEAERTLECLNNAGLTEQFDTVFIHKADEPCYRFDAIARLPLPSDAQLAQEISEATEISSRRAKYAEKVYKVLTEGLTDRVTLVHVSYPGQKPFSTKTGKKQTDEVKELVIGFLLDSKAINRTLDRGPPPEEKRKAALFRKFWGDKAELRRLSDGSILESVTWSAKSKIPVYQQIIRYVIGRHFNEAQAEAISFIGDAFDHLVSGEQTSTAFQPVYDAFDRLDKDLKAMSGLPLAMRHVSAASPALRAASIDLPFTPSNPLMEPADVVVQFESSSRWPDDLVAIQKTKASFLIKMGEILEQEHDGELITRVGLENEDCEIKNYSFLDVVYLSGPSFRIRIYHDREASLLQNRCNHPALLLKEKEAAQEALADHQRTFVLGPRHTDAIRQLCHRYPLMSPTIRLLKRWFSIQLLFPHITEEFLELIAARTFLYPYPYTAPSSVMTGFLRSLHFLAKWDWRLEPLILDLSSEGLKTDDFNEIRSNFEAMRKKDPAMNHVAMFAASNHDRVSSLWTENNHPPKVVAARITALSRAVDEAVKSQGLELDVSKLFAQSTKDFDFVVRLEQKFVVRRKEKKKVEFKNLAVDEEGVTAEDIARLSFNPAADFVKELRMAYKGTVVFFYGPQQNVVGGIWVPQGVRKWKPGLGYNTIQVKVKKTEETEKEEEEGIMVAVNKKAILNEIERIGGELVKEVVVNRE